MPDTLEEIIGDASLIYRCSRLLNRIYKWQYLSKLSKLLILITLTMEDSVSHFTIFFEGHVQGVGFRFSTLQLAKGFDLTGSVQNLVDGRVQLELEGERSECVEFIRSLSEEMAGFIRNTGQTESERAPQFKEFTIR